MPKPRRCAHKCPKCGTLWSHWTYPPSFTCRPYRGRKEQLCHECVGVMLHGPLPDAAHGAET